MEKIKEILDKLEFLAETIGREKQAFGSDYFDPKTNTDHINKLMVEADHTRDQLFTVIRESVVQAIIDVTRS